MGAAYSICVICGGRNSAAQQVLQVVAGVRLVFPVQQIPFFYVPLRLGIIAAGSIDEIISERIDVLLIH